MKISLNMSQLAGGRGRPRAAAGVLGCLQNPPHISLKPTLNFSSPHTHDRPSKQPTVLIESIKFYC